MVGKPLGAEDAVCLGRFGRVDVLRVHEPARLVRPDRQERDSGSAEACTDGRVVRAFAGVTAEVHALPLAADEVAAPEVHVAVAEPAGTPMLRGSEGDAHLAYVA